MEDRDRTRRGDGMTRLSPPWTDEQTALAHATYTREIPPALFLQIVGRTKHAARRRMAYIDRPGVARKKCEEKIALRLRQKQGEPPKPLREVPDDVLANAIRRASAPRSITAWLCGDPPFSQSALGKKQQAEASA